MLSLFTYGLTLGLAEMPSDTKEVAKHAILSQNAKSASDSTAIPKIAEPVAELENSQSSHQIRTIAALEAVWLRKS